MIKKIKTYLLVALLGLTLGAPALVPTATTFAGCTSIAKQVSEGANQAAAGTGDDCNSSNGVSDSSITDLARKAVNLFSLIIGAIAIIMIIFGGFRYITSGGDSGRVGSAKNTLIYAIVGLIIVAFAQLIVHFILAQTGSVITTS